MIRESASAGVIWKCWSNISFRLDSAILLSASRRLPLYPKPSARAPGADGSGGGGERAGDGERGRETLDRGLKRPIEDLQTRFHPLSPIPLPLNLPLLLVSLSLSFSSHRTFPNPPSAVLRILLVFLLPRPPPTFGLVLHARLCGSERDDELPGKTERNAELRKYAD